MTSVAPFSQPARQKCVGLHMIGCIHSGQGQLEQPQEPQDPQEPQEPQELQELQDVQPQEVLQAAEQDALQPQDAHEELEEHDIVGAPP